MSAVPVPSLRWLTAPADVGPELRTALVRCWRDVVNTGGSVGFARQVPVTDDVVAPAVDDYVQRLDPRLCRLLIAHADGALAGWLVLIGNGDPVVAHWGRVVRLQTAPPFRGTGAGRALMTEVARAARDDLGLEQLRLEVRGGMGLEAFYARLGYRVVGRWPGALQIGEDDRRDEVLLQLDLG